MKRLLAAAAAGLVCLIAIAPASAFGPGNNPNAHANCEATIDRQIAAGTQSGGGKKDDVAPTNCDHFWQAQGLIGNGVPGGS